VTARNRGATFGSKFKIYLEGPMDSNHDEHNRGGLIAFTFSIAFCLIFFIYISFIHPGVDLKEVPADVPGATGPADAPAAQELDITKVAKPWVEDPKVAEYGHKIFKNNCVICHGEKGLGDGPAGAALVPPPRNFVEGKWKKSGDSIGLFTTIQNGLPPSSMASFKHLPKADRWALVQFIRSITKNKIPDDPKKLDAFAATAE
jgi:mono/diheme cytochrome c family protein